MKINKLYFPCHFNGVKAMDASDRIRNCIAKSQSVLDLSYYKTLSNNVFHELLDVLVNHSFLERLVLDRMFLYDRLYTELTEALHQSTLKGISIKNFNLFSNGAEELASALKVNTSLEDIDLHYNYIGNEGILAIIRAVFYNKSTKLKKLDVSSNKIGDDGVVGLAGLLNFNTTIEELKMSCNTIGENGALGFSTALTNNKSSNLKILDISSCKIGHGAVLFANMLRENKTLQVLNMGSNSIGSAGAELLAMALHDNDTLEELILYGNNIDAVGAYHIAEMLKKNTGLRKLDLSNNDIGDEGAVFLAEAFKQNETLRNIRLYNCQIFEVGGLALIKALRENKKLRVLNFDDGGYLQNHETIDFKQIAEETVKGNTNVLSLMPFYELPSLPRNREHYLDEYWSPSGHSDFPQSFHNLMITVMLCSQEDMRLGYHAFGNFVPPKVIQYILSFYQRKKFLNLKNYHYWEING